jgi:hypothetical protein
MLALSHSRPSYRPSPLVAQAALDASSVYIGNPRNYRIANLDEPCPLPETVETEFVGDLRRVHGIGQILLISEDKQEGVTELILVEHTL